MKPRITTLLAVAALLTGTCGGTPTSGGGWPELLALIPDTPENRISVVLEDFNRVRQPLGISRPGAGASGDTLAEYLMAVTTGPVSDATTTPVTRSPLIGLAYYSMDGQLGAQHLTDIAAWRSEMGVAFTDLDADAVAGRPPDTLAIWSGDIDPGRVEAALAADPVWGPDLIPLTHAGIDHWCWGADPGTRDPERRTTTRPFGIGGCLAAFDGIAYRTRTAEAMQAALETRAGEHPSLADHDDLLLAAHALNRAGTYSAYLTTHVDFYAAEKVLARPSRIDPALPRLSPYLVLGTGAGFDDDGEYVVIALVYPDEAAARANIAVMRRIATEGSMFFMPRQWSEIIDEIRSIDADGRVLVTVLETGWSHRLWHQLPNVPDTLTWWE